MRAQLPAFRVRDLAALRPLASPRWKESCSEPDGPNSRSVGPRIHVTHPTALESLRAAFAAIAQNASALSPQETEVVRRRVLDVVDELKAAGALPERIIVAIKKLAAEVGIAWTGSVLLEQIVNWSVEHFYAHAEDGSAVPPR